MVEKVKLSWSTIEHNVKLLSDKLKNQKFDAVVAIGRGGMIPARLLAEELDIHTAYVVDAKAYTEDNKLGEVQISDVKFRDDVKSIILIDDVLFTGTTLEAAFNNIVKNNSQVEHIANAFLYKNDKTQYDDMDYEYAEEYDGDKYWLVFPWER